jgi:hypothetical protein
MQDFEVVCDLVKNQKVAQCAMLQPFVRKFKCSFVEEKNTFVCDLNIKEYAGKVEEQLNSANRSVSAMSSFMSFFGVHGAIGYNTHDTKENVKINSAWRQ